MKDKKKMAYLGTGALTAALVFGGLGAAYGQDDGRFRPPGVRPDDDGQGRRPPRRGGR